MEHASYASRLRYLDAGDVDDSNVDFSDLEVRGHDNAKLGDIDGFIVDAATGRVFHIVVDSGGWFSSRRFLLPVGHATIDREHDALRVDVTRDALSRYPEFHDDRFRAFSDDDLRTFERRTAEACCPDEPFEDVSVGTWAWDARRHYTQPAWWQSERLAQHERLAPIGSGVAGVAAAAGTAAAGRPAASETFDRDLVTARERDRVRDDDLRRDGREADAREPLRDERRTRYEDSPHLDGRAQPGDVLGLETGGETTTLGETTEDENKRRRSAEETARKLDSD